jgi:hypothetical protein
MAIRFKSFAVLYNNGRRPLVGLLESEDAIDHHMQTLKDQGRENHAQFTQSFLGDDPEDRHRRSRYLPFVTNPRKMDIGVAPNHLASAIDYFHSAKNKKTFGFPKDINQYKNHGEFVDSMGRSIRAPISAEEGGYSHPDNKETHNENGLRILDYGSKDASIATRDPRFCSNKDLRNNSWCTSRHPDEDANYYDDYNKLQLLQYRDIDGRIRSMNYGESGRDHEIKNEKNGSINHSDIPEHIRDEIYEHGPHYLKGNLDYATKQKHFDDYLTKHNKTLADLRGSEQTSFMSSPYAKQALDSAIDQGAVSYETHRRAASDPELLKHMLARGYSTDAVFDGAMNNKKTADIFVNSHGGLDNFVKNEKPHRINLNLNNIIDHYGNEGLESLDKAGFLKGEINLRKAMYSKAGLKYLIDKKANQIPSEIRNKIHQNAGDVSDSDNLVKNLGGLDAYFARPDVDTREKLSYAKKHNFDKDILSKISAKEMKDPYHQVDILTDSPEAAHNLIDTHAENLTPGTREKMLIDSRYTDHLIQRLGGIDSYAPKMNEYEQRAIINHPEYGSKVIDYHGQKLDPNTITHGLKGPHADRILDALPHGKLEIDNELNAIKNPLTREKYLDRIGGIQNVDPATMLRHVNDNHMYGNNDYSLVKDYIKGDGQLTPRVHAYAMTAPDEELRKMAMDKAGGIANIPSSMHAYMLRHPFEFPFDSNNHDDTMKLAHNLIDAQKENLSPEAKEYALSKPDLRDRYIKAVGGFANLTDNEKNKLSIVSPHFAIEAFKARKPGDTIPSEIQYEIAKHGDTSLFADLINHVGDIKNIHHEAIEKGLENQKFTDEEANKLAADEDTVNRSGIQRELLSNKITRDKTLETIGGINKIHPSALQSIMDDPELASKAIDEWGADLPISAQLAVVQGHNSPPEIVKKMINALGINLSYQATNLVRRNYEQYAHMLHVHPRD